MALQLMNFADSIVSENKKANHFQELEKLRENLIAKEKAADDAMEALERAVKEADETREKLAEVIAKQDEKISTSGNSGETNEQKIARLEQELADIKRIQELEKQLADVKATKSTTEVAQKETKVTTTKVDAEKLNISSPPKAEATTEVYEPEAPNSGAKGSAARRK